MSSPPLLPHGSTGIAVHADDPGFATARQLEQLGYDTLWLAGGELDRLDRVDELLAATTTARVATGIVPLGVYDIDAIAGHVRQLHQTAPGRYVLGLGGPQVARPMEPLRGYLTELDDAGVPAVSRLLAALGPAKLRLAAQRAAGAITLLTTPSETAAARAELGAGPVLAVQQVAVYDTDARRAREAVHPMIGFLGRVGGYRASFGRMGFGDADVDAISDPLVDAVTVWGDAGTIAARVAEQREAGADHVAISLVDSGNGVPVVAAAAAIAAAL